MRSLSDTRSARRRSPVDTSSDAAGSSLEDRTADSGAGSSQMVAESSDYASLMSASDEEGERERRRSNREAGPSGVHRWRRCSKATDRAVVQPGEDVSLPSFAAKIDKPMMEMKAGSNVWYQAHILLETHNELRVLFPAPTEDGEDVKEWVRKSSSRLWRGSLAGRDWRYLGKGAWAPRKKPKPARSRGTARAAARPRPRRPRKRALHEPLADHLDDGTDATPTNAVTSTRTALSEELSGEEAVASPDMKRAVALPRRAPALSDGDGSDSEVVDIEWVSPRRGVRVAQAAEPVSPKGGVPDQTQRGPVDPVAVWFQVHYARLAKALDSQVVAHGTAETGRLLFEKSGKGSIDASQPQSSRA